MQELVLLHTIAHQYYCIAGLNQVIKTLELENVADSLVGGAEEGGGLSLSFEQRKRVSIAVELAASPSVIFLDEPTSGLDARSALLVVKLLRKIADEGRTICCTIHQPSSGEPIQKALVAVFVYLPWLET